MLPVRNAVLRRVLAISLIAYNTTSCGTEPEDPNPLIGSWHAVSFQAGGQDAVANGMQLWMEFRADVPATNQDGDPQFDLAAEVTGGNPLAMCSDEPRFFCRVDGFYEATPTQVTIALGSSQTLSYSVQGKTLTLSGSLSGEPLTIILDGGPPAQPVLALVGQWNATSFLVGDHDVIAEGMTFLLVLGTERVGHLNLFSFFARVINGDVFGLCPSRGSCIFGGNYTASASEVRLGSVLGDVKLGYALENGILTLSGSISGSSVTIVLERE